jgi:membrane protease YdiL (CAAX protease family)
MFSFSSDPDVISWSYLLQFVVLAPLAVQALRSSNVRWDEAISLKIVPAKTLTLWTLIWLLFWSVCALVYRLLPHAPDPFLLAINGTRHVGLTLTSVLVAPLFEEIIFRACGFRLWRHTRLGLSGTLLLTSLLFALIHIQQYSWQLLMFTFGFGMILGLSREKTGSLLVPLILHTLNNLFAVILIIWLGVQR